MKTTAHIKSGDVAGDNLKKSILDGLIWDVPWPLVALMGFSQAGYLAPKLARD